MTPPPSSQTLADIFAARDRRLEEMARKYGASKGRMETVNLGPVFAPSDARRRIVKVPLRRAPAVYGRHAEPTPLEAALLDAVHRHHLRALAAMDRETVGRHARGMALAGYAYGFHDPVCNILANAFWYDAMFPASSGPEVEPKFLTCNAMLRLARHSLNAMVAFVRAYAPTLSAEEALSYLSRSHGNLRHAAMLVDGEGIGHADRMDEALRA